MNITKASYIPVKFRFWERVALVFEGLDYDPPKPDNPDGGGYVTNIASQYLNDFTFEEIVQIVEYAQHNTVENLQQAKANGWIDRAAVFGERKPLV